MVDDVEVVQCVPCNVIHRVKNDEIQLLKHLETLTG